MVLTAQHRSQTHIIPNERHIKMNKQNGRSNATTATNTPAKRSRLSTVRGRVTTANTTEYCVANAKTILLGISVVQAVGGAIMFSGTRDGGALVITVLDGNDNEKFYCKDAAEVEATLNDVANAFKPDILPEVYAHILDAIGE